MTKEINKNLLLTRADIPNCNNCEADSTGVEFEGIKNIQEHSTSHFTSEDGWWMIIEHIRNSIFEEPDSDRVKRILCPACGEEDSKRIAEFLNL